MTRSSLQTPPNNIKPKIRKAPSQNYDLRGSLDDPQQSVDTTQQHQAKDPKSALTDL